MPQYWLFSCSIESDIIPVSATDNWLLVWSHYKLDHIILGKPLNGYYLAVGISKVSRCDVQWLPVADDGGLPVTALVRPQRPICYGFRGTKCLLVFYNRHISECVKIGQIKGWHDLTCYSPFSGVGALFFKSGMS